MLECLKTDTFRAAVPAYWRLMASPLLAHRTWKIFLQLEGRFSSGGRIPSFLNCKKKSCFFKWVSTSWLWYMAIFFSRIMMLNSSIALDIICHIFLNTGAMFLYFKVQIIKTFLKKYRFGQLLVFPWQFERRLSDWHWFCPDSPHSWPWTRLFVHRLYPPCSTLSKKRKQYRYSMYFILNFSFI